MKARKRREFGEYIVSDPEVCQGGNMDLKEFATYLHGKSLSQLLHRARKESLKRILAHGETLEAARKKPVQKRTGTR